MSTTSSTPTSPKPQKPHHHITPVHTPSPVPEKALFPQPSPKRPSEGSRMPLKMQKCLDTEHDITSTQSSAWCSTKLSCLLINERIWHWFSAAPLIEPEIHCFLRSFSCIIYRFWPRYSFRPGPRLRVVSERSAARDACNNLFFMHLEQTRGRRTKTICFPCFSRAEIVFVFISLNQECAQHFHFSLARRAPLIASIGPWDIPPDRLVGLRLLLSLTRPGGACLWDEGALQLISLIRRNNVSRVSCILSRSINFYFN